MTARSVAGLRRFAEIPLPPHKGAGGFDHAAVHRSRGLLYVAHTANDAVDVIDVHGIRHVHSTEGLAGVAGVWVDEQDDLVFTSNRREDSVGILSPGREAIPVKIHVGHRPNGLAYDPGRGILLSANVGDPTTGRGGSVTLVDMRSREPIRSIDMPGRTRWAVYDSGTDSFFVNIADPFEIVVIKSSRSDRIARRIPVPARGPHGLELDRAERRLLCACDEGKLVAVDTTSGQVRETLELTGVPDVVFLNRTLGHLYVAIGDPGVIDVIDIASWKRVEVVPTEVGAHTIAYHEEARTVYAFLPGSHRAVVFEDVV